MHTFDADQQLHFQFMQFRNSSVQLIPYREIHFRRTF